MRDLLGAMGLVMALVQGIAAAGDGLVETLLRSRPEWFDPILGEVDRYEVQILYTQIDRDAANRPCFTPHAYRVDPEAYFYPASAIKLAGALLALERLNLLGIEGLDRNTPLRIDSASAGQRAVLEDETAPGGLPTISHYVKKLFAVSDNDAYNRLYEFLGQQYLNEALWRKGYRDVRLTHRLSLALSPEENRCTNPFVFYIPGDPERIVYRQPLVVNPHRYRASAPILKGVARKEGDELIGEPKDFSQSNFMSVHVLQEMLTAALFPESVPGERRFALIQDDYRFLYRVMSMLPRECRHPQYDANHYYDSYVKFFLFGDSREPVPGHIRLFNKVGLAYGYLIDNAYVVDFERKIEFLLTAVISVNENQVYNDGQYEYDEVGFPFLARLGRVVYEHELRRKRPRAPDLSRFAVQGRP